MRRLLAIGAIALAMPGCGTINALRSASQHGRYKDIDQREVGRTQAAADHHIYGMILRDITGEGVDFAVQQEDICSVRVDHKANQRAQRTGRTLFQFTGEPDMDIAIATAMDLVGGGLVVSLASMSAHYNPNGSPESWSGARNMVWGITLGVVGVDVAAYAYSVKRRSKVRTWHTTETKTCSEKGPVHATAKLTVTLEGKGGHEPTAMEEGRFRTQAPALGAALMQRKKVDQLGPISWGVTVNQSAGPAQLRGSASFTESIGSGMVMRYAREWRCAALGAEGGADLLNGWDVVQQSALYQQLALVECAPAALVKTRLCATSREEAAKGRQRPTRTLEEIGIFVNTCGDKKLWTQVVDGDLKTDLAAEQLDRVRYSTSRYEQLFGQKWAAAWNKKAEALVSKRIATLLAKKSENSTVEASDFLVSQKAYVADRTLGKLRGRLQSSGKGFVAARISKEDFSGARVLIGKLKPGAGESWAKGQERLLAGAIKKRDARLAAAVKWCRDSRYRVLQKVIPFKQCMVSANQGPEMYRRRSRDEDLYVQRMREGSMSCVSKLGLTSTIQRFVRDCECEDVDSFTYEDSSGWDHEPCSDLEEELDEAQDVRERRAGANKVVRACIDLEQRLISRQWSWRQCMVDQESVPRMQQYHRSDEDLYDEMMRRAARICLDRVGMRKTMQRLATKCDCRKMDMYDYEDRDRNDHDACEEFRPD